MKAGMFYILLIFSMFLISSSEKSTIYNHPANFRPVLGVTISCIPHEQAISLKEVFETKALLNIIHKPHFEPSVNNARFLSVNISRYILIKNPELREIIREKTEKFRSIPADENDHCLL